jgi:hypothetical protein
LMIASSGWNVLRGWEGVLDYTLGDGLGFVRPRDRIGMYGFALF